MVEAMVRIGFSLLFFSFLLRINVFLIISVVRGTVLVGNLLEGIADQLIKC